MELELGFTITQILVENFSVINKELLKFCLNNGDMISGLLFQETWWGTIV